MGIIDAARSQYTGGSGGGGKYRAADLVVTVKGYDLEKGQVLVEQKLENGDTHAFAAVINKNAPKSTRPEADFEGNVVDNRMAEYMPEGSRIILEGALLPKSGELSADRPVIARWIRATPENEGKLVQGTFTLSGYRTPSGELKASGVQQWTKQAIDAAELAKYADLFDASHKQSVEVKAAIEAGQASDKLPPVTWKPGFALRTIAPGADGPEVVDFLPPMVRNPLTKNNFSWNEAAQALTEYTEYAKEKYGKDVTIEAIFVREFPASNTFDTRGPNGTMINTSCAMSPDQDAPTYGNAILGVQGGVLLLSPGKLNPKTGKRKGEENDWASTLIASSAKGPVHQFVLTADGELPRMNSVLTLNYPTPARDAEQGNAPEQAAAPAEAPAEASVADDLENVGDAIEKAQAQEKSGPGM